VLQKRYIAATMRRGELPHPRAVLAFGVAFKIYGFALKRNRSSH